MEYRRYYRYLYTKKGYTKGRITFMSTPAKILEEELESTLEETQYGFRRARSTHAPIFIIKPVIDKSLREAFDRINREDIRKAEEIVDVMKAPYEETQSLGLMEDASSVLSYLQWW